MKLLKTRYVPRTSAKTKRTKTQEDAARRRLATRLAKAKESVFRASRSGFEINERLIRLAINEAEAIAWETGLPHLVFPILAEEKIRALSTWNTRQELLWRAEPIVALAE
jgi:hypothetical protein